MQQSWGFCEQATCVKAKCFWYDMAAPRWTRADIPATAWTIAAYSNGIASPAEPRCPFTRRRESEPVLLLLEPEFGRRCPINLRRISRHHRGFRHLQGCRQIKPF